MIIDGLKYFTLRQDVKHVKLGETEYTWDESDVMVTQAALLGYIENKSYISKALISFETKSDKGIDTKPHFQGFIAVDYAHETFKDLKSSNEQTVKNHVRDSKILGVLPLHKAPGYSCTVMKKETYMSYIKKGKDIRIKHNYTEDEIEDIPEWISYHMTKEQKKLTRREEFSRDFIGFVKRQKAYDERCIDDRQIAGFLVDFMGERTIPEMLPWLRSVVFHTISVLRSTSKSLNDKQKNLIKDKLISQILSYN